MTGKRERITTATTGDVDDLAPLFNAYREFFAGYGDINESREFIGARVIGGESVVFLARSGGEAAGFIQLYPLWSSWYCRRIWFLSDLYVAEAYRNRGLGARLVERAVAFAKETAASSVMVELPHREPHLAAFYDRLGFRRDEVFDLARYLI